MTTSQDAKYRSYFAESEFLPYRCNFAQCEASKQKRAKLRVVGKGVLDEAIKRHGDLSGPLAAWFKIACTEAWAGLNDIRKTYPSTDAHKGKFIFNIKGNNYRLIATINFRSQTLIIEHVLTHAEYDKEEWK